MKLMHVPYAAIFAVYSLFSIQITGIVNMTGRDIMVGHQGNSRIIPAHTRCELIGFDMELQELVSHQVTSIGAPIVRYTWRFSSDKSVYNTGKFVIIVNKYGEILLSPAIS